MHTYSSSRVIVIVVVYNKIIFSFTYFTHLCGWYLYQKRHCINNDDDDDKFLYMVKMQYYYTLIVRSTWKFYMGWHNHECRVGRNKGTKIFLEEVFLNLMRGNLARIENFCFSLIYNPFHMVRFHFPIIPLRPVLFKMS